MVKDFQNFTDRASLTKRLAYPIKYSVLFATGDNWKRIRNILTATFSASKLKQIFPIIDDICDRCVDRLLVLNENGETPNMKAIYGKFTMEVITATAFGVRVDNDPRGDKLIKVATDLFNSLAIFQLIVILVPSFEPLIRQFLWKRNHAVKYLTDTIQDIIRERRQCLQNGTPCNRDLLQLIIEAAENGKLSNDEIVGQSYIFMIAGYETSANTLTFATYLLATHPDIQDKLYREIKEKYEEKGVLRYDTISELQYLDMVLSETLRMYPPAFVVNRRVNKDTVINGIPIKEEMTVGIPIYGIHHDAEYWPNPDQFDPDRFTTEAKQARHPFTYMPFGAGPRNCIGMRLALIEIKLALAKILKRIEFYVIDKTEIPLKLSSSASLSPTNGVYLGIKKRS